MPWQTDTAIGRQSWGYRADNSYKSARQIICDLVDIVSKNGMLLLNVGPKADGSITDEETAVLKELGQWMAVNGPGIYETQPWKRFGEGAVNAQAGYFQDNAEKPYTAQDFRFTYKGGCIYAFQMRPAQKAVIRSLRREQHDLVVRQVRLLGSDTPLRWERDGEGLTISLPQPPETALPLCFEICLG